MDDIGMTDNQLKYVNRLILFIRKLLKLVPKNQRQELENEFDDILQSNLES